VSTLLVRLWGFGRGTAGESDSMAAAVAFVAVMIFPPSEGFVEPLEFK
jgi:hypothetical protein